LNALAALVCGTALALEGSALAQQRDPVSAAGDRQEQAAPTVQSRDAGAQTSQQRQQLVRVSGENLPQGLFTADDLEGIDLFNTQHEEVGEIEEVVIDSRTGEVRYVAVEVGGGPLGIGGDLVALPWEALLFTHRQGDPDEAVVVLKGGRQWLQNAPAIEEDGMWPTTGKVSQARQTRSPEGVDAEQQVEAREQVRSTRRLPQGLFRADELEGLDIFNARNEELGEIEEIVIDVETGTVRYVAVEVGSGFLGIGGDLVAVPWDAMRLTHKEADPDDIVVVLNVDRQTIENAPTIDDDTWPAWAHTEWLPKDQREARQSATGEEPARR
jgi:sporulation protein YlmC with PRC-barrel domain